MKRFLFCLLILSACSQNKTERALPDSTLTDTTLTVIENTPLDDEEKLDTSRLVILFDQKLDEAVNGAEYYVVTITGRQYEGQSEVTWHFDKQLAAKYVKESWSTEGKEGITELIVDDAEVVCSMITESYVITKWCSETGGVKTTWDEDYQTSADQEVASGYEILIAREYLDYRNELVRLLKEARITAEDADRYVLRIEQTVDVGQRVTESVQIDIPKPVYKKLIR